MEKNREVRVEFVSFDPKSEKAKIRIVDWEGKSEEYMLGYGGGITVFLEAANLIEVNQKLDTILKNVEKPIYVSTREPSIQKLNDKTMNPLEYAYIAIITGLVGLVAVIIGSMIFWGIMWWFIL